MQKLKLYTIYVKYAYRKCVGLFLRLLLKICDKLTQYLLTDSVEIEYNIDEYITLPTKNMSIYVINMLLKNENKDCENLDIYLENIEIDEELVYISDNLNLYPIKK